MKLALALFHYFPYGGLERDMLAIAREAMARGHEVRIFTTAWEGAEPEGLQIRKLPVKGFGNHVRMRHFAQRLEEAVRAWRPDCLLGFNRLPGLDFYFAADTCFARKVHEERGAWYRLLPRARQYLAFEQSVYGPGSATRILALTEAQIADFQRYYDTPAERFHLLPPGIRRDRVMPDDYTERRRALRQAFGLADDRFLLLMVGSDFRRKGLARSIRALAALPESLRSRVQLWVAGRDAAQPFERLARKLGVAAQLKLLGARDDVPQLLWSADALLHPAYSEAAGAVLIEAMVAGLPVLATRTCGYAPWIVQAGMGEVLPDTAEDAELAAAIVSVLQTDRTHWQARARALIAGNEVFSMHQTAVSHIEAQGCSREGA